MSGLSGCVNYLKCANCKGTPATHNDMHKLHEFHVCVHCVLHELNILGKSYECRFELTSHVSRSRWSR